MDYNKKKNHMIDSVFVICLMLLFLLCALTIIAIGASIYKKNVSLMADNNSHRIATAYITEKIRQSDKNGAISVQQIFGESAIVMTDEIGGKFYNTYIYDYDGNLMELYARDDLGSIYPQSGQKIMEIKSLDVKEISENMLSVTFVLPDGSSDNLIISKRSQKTG